MKKQLTWAVVDRTAADMGVNYAARLKWRQPSRGVPELWRYRIAERLKGKRYNVDMAAFDALPSNPGRVEK